MSFNVVLQYNSSEPTVLDKNLLDIMTLTGTLREETSLIDPSILIEEDISSLSRVNYLTISSFNRSYFVNRITSVRSGLVRLDCHVDVLFTYRAEIRANRGIIAKNAYESNAYLNDDTFKTFQPMRVQTLEFPFGFTDRTFVLAVAGHVGSN